MRRPRPATRWLALLLMLPIALLAACGDDGDTAAAGTEPASGSGSGSAPAGANVTVEHADGTTTIAGRPERIVTLGLQWTDAVLAFGVQPVGFAKDLLAAEDGMYPWHREQLEGVTALDVSGGLPLESVAALDPDLILAVPYLSEDEGLYETLSEIAPTIVSVTGAQVDAWQDQVEVVGEVLGEPELAASIVGEVDDLMAATAEELPGLQGKTFAMANHIPGDSIYVVADPEDGASVFFQTLGMELPEELLAVADGISGRAHLSLEQVELLSSDLLILFNNGGDPTDLVGYEQLPAVVDGAVSNLDYVDVVALNTPTAMSIPHALAIVRPALEAAAS